DELNLGGNAHGRPVAEALLAGLLREAVQKDLLLLEDLDAVGFWRATVRRADLHHLGGTALGIVLDQLPGDPSAGAVADKDNLLVAHPAQPGDILVQATVADNVVQTDVLTVAEGKHVGVPGQRFDQDAAGALPVAE